MKIAFTTLGCKVNQYETAVLTDIFKKAGYEIVSHGTADVYIINSCAVTAQSGKKAEKIIRRLRRENPFAIIALTGCLPQAFPKETSALKDVDVLTGTKNRRELLTLVENAIKTHTSVKQIYSHTPNEEFEPMVAIEYSERTRATIKIEDGCDRYCSYCIIPKARGPVRSKPAEDILAELRLLAEKGYKEVVLSGINLSSYGKENGYKTRLSDIVLLANSVEKIERIRLGSLEPELMTSEDLQKLYSCEKFCPQFHLSLQSGCDKTLADMNRRYDTSLYRELVCNIRKLFDNPSVTTDVMVGFPGETESDFIQSAEFVRDIAFARTHIFPYSPREGTKAAELLQIDEQTKNLRAEAMAKYAAEGLADFLATQYGREALVLVERPDKDGFVQGYSKNYTKMYINNPVGSVPPCENQIVNVRTGKPFKDGCLADIIL